MAGKSRSAFSPSSMMTDLSSLLARSAQKRKAPAKNSRGFEKFSL